MPDNFGVRRKRVRHCRHMPDNFGPADNAFLNDPGVVLGPCGPAVLRRGSAPDRSYKVYAPCERFFRANCEYFRTNQLRRRVIDKATGDQIGDELVRENCALVRYVPTNVGIIDRAA